MRLPGEDTQSQCGRHIPRPNGEAPLMIISNVWDLAPTLLSSSYTIVFLLFTPVDGSTCHGRCCFGCLKAHIKKKEGRVQRSPPVGHSGKGKTRPVRNHPCWPGVRGRRGSSGCRTEGFQGQRRDPVGCCNDYTGALYVDPKPTAEHRAGPQDKPWASVPNGDGPVWAPRLWEMQHTDARCSQWGKPRTSRGDGHGHTLRSAQCFCKPEPTPKKIHKVY